LTVVVVVLVVVVVVAVVVCGGLHFFHRAMEAVVLSNGRFVPLDFKRLNLERIDLFLFIPCRWLPFAWFGP
jgi:hypothetical protein